MIRNSLLAGASRFAHLGGLTRASRQAADDDQNDNSRAEEDENDEKASEDDEDDKPSGKSGKKSRAEDDDRNDQASEGDDDEDKPAGKRGSRADDGDDDEDDKPQGKRSRRAAEDDDENCEDEDDDKEEMSGRSAKAAARRRERARCAAIFAHPSAAHNTELAASLAFDTSLTRKEVIAVLSKQSKRSSAADADRLSGRSSRNVNLGGGGPGPSRQQAVNAGWDRAFAQAGVKVPSRS